MEGWKEEEERERKRGKERREGRRGEERTRKEGWREEGGGSGFRSHVTLTTCMSPYCTLMAGQE